MSNIRIDGRVAHFELGQIPEHATEMRVAANFLVANYGRQKIITMPRSVPKIAIFEEAARTLEIPGGVRMIQEYYRQMRKFGCNILAVVQQYDVLKTSEVRGAMIGNSKMFLKLKSSSSLDLFALFGSTRWHKLASDSGGSTATQFERVPATMSARSS
ncbi:MAG: type secretion system protein TrbE [Acidobacteriaceae bacterium]|nr:type secretion system protein TrbE [Acidobacteriaceae bacterium]